jgi:hypothetical protein
LELVWTVARGVRFWPADCHLARKGESKVQYILAWLLGVPLVIIVLLWLFGIL